MSIESDAANSSIIFVTIVKGICFSSIILTALFGNLLVLIAVCCFHRLRRVRTNSFLVSLAMADLLVALTAMPLNAWISLNNGLWPFGKLFCDLFNANDVFFSTASILHLCVIAMERYVAIIHPLRYEHCITRTRIALMLAFIWTLSLMISHLPLHTGIYTTIEQWEKRHSANYSAPECLFNVNPAYAIISSMTSFWLPSLFMLIVYLRVFKEARKQEAKICQLRINQHNFDHQDGSTKEVDCNNNNNNLDATLAPIERNSISKRISRDSTSKLLAISKQQMKIRRENRAARTLGLVMGAFLLCFLPFFSWYSITNTCTSCYNPLMLGEIVFWIGYFNSTLNPIIYAFYNRGFRSAFRSIIKHVLCCRSTVRTQSTMQNTRRCNQSRLSVPRNDTESLSSNA